MSDINLSKGAFSDESGLLDSQDDDDGYKLGKFYAEHLTEATATDMSL